VGVEKGSEYLVFCSYLLELRLNFELYFLLFFSLVTANFNWQVL